MQSKIKKAKESINWLKEELQINTGLIMGIQKQVVNQVEILERQKIFIETEAGEVRDLVDENRKKNKSQFKVVQNIFEELRGLIAEVQKELETNVKGLQYQISNQNLCYQLPEPQGTFSDWASMRYPEAEAEHR